MQKSENILSMLSGMMGKRSSNRLSLQVSKDGDACDDLVGNNGLFSIASTTVVIDDKLR